jgi:hypothetical protein
MYKIIKREVGYVHGLNAVPFCEKRSGIYFTQQDKIPLWIHIGVYICSVIIPDDARVCVEKHNFKADKIILDLDKMTIAAFYETKDIDCLSAVRLNAKCLKYIKNPTEQMCKCAIDQYTLALEYLERHANIQLFKEQSEDISLYVVNTDGLFLEFITRQTEAICNAAVEH